MVRTYEKLIHDQLTGFRYVAVLMGVFGVVALVLATVGVYSVMAYMVAERTHELGVRMALGAASSNVLWLVVRRGMLLAVIGLALGLIAGQGVARMLAGILFGVGAHDWSSMAIVVISLFGAALLACYVPARRATRVDPVVALRVE
jgi:putative ABC transport system permease protein